MKNAGEGVIARKGSPMLLVVLVIIIAATIMALPLILIQPTGGGGGGESHIVVDECYLAIDHSEDYVLLKITIRNISGKNINVTTILVDGIDVKNFTILELRPGTSVSRIYKVTSTWRVDPRRWGVGSEHMVEIRYYIEGYDHPFTVTIKSRIVS